MSRFGAGAKGGFPHWWAQRLSALALVPLSLWLVVALVGRVGASRADIAAWLAEPGAALLMILSLIASLYHGMLGAETVIDDYVRGPAARLASLIVVRFAAAVLTLAGALAVLRLALA